MLNTVNSETLDRQMKRLRAADSFPDWLIAEIVNLSAQRAELLYRIHELG